MKERPILFKAPMVRAILEGRKAQTRRVVKPHLNDCGHFLHSGNVDLAHKQIAEWREQNGHWFGLSGYTTLANAACPYGQPGDRLWVRENHCFLDVVKSAMSRFPLGAGKFGPDVWNLNVEYQDGTEHEVSVEGVKPKQTRQRGEIKWRPSIHMPRWASRILLEVTCVRVERLSDISRVDAEAEGVGLRRVSETDYRWIDYSHKDEGHTFGDPRHSFWSLWKSINGEKSHDANPWVWVVEFKRVAP